MSALRCLLTADFHAAKCEPCATFAARVAQAEVGPAVRLVVRRLLVPAFGAYVSARALGPSTDATERRMRHALSAAASLARLELVRALTS